MRLPILALAGILAIVAGCGPRPLDEEFREHPAGVLPEGASQVLYARIDRLDANPLAQLAVEKLGAVKWGRTLEGIVQSLRLSGEAERMAVGVYGGLSQEPPTAVMVALGKLSEETFRSGLEERGTPYVTGSYREQTIYTSGRGNERSYASFPGEGVLVAGSDIGLVKKILDVAGGKAKSLAADSGFEPLLKGYSESLSLWATGVLPMSIVVQIIPDALSSPLAAVEGFAVQLSGDATRRLTLIFYCTTTEAAETNAQFLSRLIGQMATQFAVMGYRIDPLLNAINRNQIFVDGATIEFPLEMTAEEIEATARAFREGPSEPRSLLDEMLPPAGVPMPPGGMAPVPGEMPLQPTPAPPRSP